MRAKGKKWSGDNCGNCAPHTREICRTVFIYCQSLMTPAKAQTLSSTVNTKRWKCRPRVTDGRVQCSRETKTHRMPSDRNGKRLRQLYQGSTQCQRNAAIFSWGFLFSSTQETFWYHFLRKGRRGSVANKARAFANFIIKVPSQLSFLGVAANFEDALEKRDRVGSFEATALHFVAHRYKIQLSKTAGKSVLN